MNKKSLRRGRGSAEIHTLGSAGSTPASATIFPIFQHDEDCNCLACMQRRCIETLTEHSMAQTEEIHKLRHDVMQLGDRLARVIGSGR